MNSAKNSEDEMRHKLLQISSRGVQIPCYGRYLNSFRGVCGTLFKRCIRGNSGFRSDVDVRGPADLGETLSESHHTASVELWPGGRGIGQITSTWNREKIMQCVEAGCLPRWQGPIRTAR